jgi:hypothetical protein
MSIRTSISNAYWAAVEKLGPLVPTPQVVAAGAAAIAGGLLDKYAIDLSVVGLSPALVVGAVSLGVAYLIGPERDEEGQRLKGDPFTERPGVELHTPPELTSFPGGADTLPRTPGEPVGPDEGDDKTRGLL